MIIESTQGKCRTLTLNRPERKNALSVDLAQALTVALEKVSREKVIRVVLIRGQGGAFSAGGDIKYMMEFREESERLFKNISQHLNEAIDLIVKMPQVVISVIQGPAYAAGFGLALACDLVVADDTAALSPSFINIALSPNASSSYFLPRIIGTKRAAEAFFLGQVFDAHQAHDLGLVNHVWPKAQLEKKLADLVSDLSSRPQGALARIKKLIHSTYELPFHEQLESEREEIAQSSLSEDFTEGITAFLEKRPPKFS